MKKGQVQRGLSTGHRVLWNQAAADWLVCLGDVAMLAEGCSLWKGWLWAFGVKD